MKHWILSVLAFCWAAPVWATWDLKACKDALDAAVAANVSAPYNFGSATYSDNGWSVAVDCDLYGTGLPYPHCGDCNFSYDETNSPIYAKPPSYVDPICQSGSKILVDKLSVGESIPVVGTSEELVYQSYRTLGYAENSYTLPLMGATVDPNIDHFVITTNIGGQITSQTLYPASNLYYTFTWDGNDGSSNPLYLPTMASVHKHTFYVDSSVPDIPAYYYFPFGAYRSEALGLGGMTLSSVDFYDAYSHRLYFGDGSYKWTLLGKAGVDRTTGEIWGEHTGDPYPPGVDPILYVHPEKDEVEIFAWPTGRHLETRSTRTNKILKSFSYDSNGRLTAITDAYGQSISITRPTSTSAVITAPHGQTTTLSLTGGLTTSITDPLGHSHSFSYGSGGLMATYSPPGGGVSTFSYDTNGLLTGDLHSLGANLTFTSSVIPTGVMGQAVSSIHMTTSSGVTSSYSLGYAGDGNVSRGETEGNGDYNSFSYSPGSNIDSNQAAGFHIAQYLEATNVSDTYHIHNWSVSAGSDSISGITTAFSGTSGGYNMLLSGDSDRTTISGQDWIRTYSPTTISGSIAIAGIETFTSPLGRVLTVGYNSANQVTQVVPSLGAAINVVYDSIGRRSTLTQSSRQITYAYDTAGYLSSITDPLLRVTSFGYDAAGRRTSTTLPDLRVVNFSYDDDGNLTSVQTPASITHNLTYNHFDKPATYVAPTVASATYTTSYSYDNDRRLTQIARPDSSTIQFNYDATYGTLSSLVNGEGTYSYTFAGKRVSTIASPSGVTNAFAWDGPNVSVAATTWDLYSPQVSYTYSSLLESGRTFTPTSGSSVSIALGYNNDRMLTSVGDLNLTRTSSTGLVSQSTLGDVTEDFSYSPTYGELSEYSASYSGAEFFRRAYTRDLLGRISQVDETLSGTTTSYIHTASMSPDDCIL